jgi:hypothetical protein
MSHFAKIPTQFVHERELLEALRELHGEQNVKVGGRIRGWGGQTTDVDITVTLPGSYDLGFRNENGVFGLVKEDMFRYDVQNLVQSYAERVIANRLPRGKYRVLERDKGRIKLQQVT